MSRSSYLKPDTVALHTGYVPESDHGSRAVPVYQTTSYVFESVSDGSSLFNVEQGGHIYSRITNPTVAVLEQRIAALEGGSGAICTASGMSALFTAFITLCSAGDHIISATQIYGSTATLLKHTIKRLGIECSFVSVNDEQALRDAIQPNTKMVFCESIGNPGLEISDIPGISTIAHAAGIPVVVDATFATPCLCRPFDHGADVVVHSVTKWMGGHGVAIGGVIVDGGQFDWQQSGRFPELTEPYAPFHGIRFWEEFGPAALAMKMRAESMRDVGAAMSPHNAFLILQGIETLSLRMKQHVANAKSLLEWLQQQEAVTWTNYPDMESNPSHALAATLFPDGAGSMLCFGVTGGRAGGAAFIDSLQLASNLANVGDARTLVLHPASTTHSRLTGEDMKAAGISEDMIRVSVGIEDISDIKADFGRGFKAAERVAGGSLMYIDIRGQKTYAATGGKVFDSSLPTVMFVHGSGLDHRSWALQTRWFAYNGYSVLAPDLPGHSLSAGEALTSIEDMGAWLADFIRANGVSKVHAIGHSQGFLDVLELARQAPELLKSITGIGTAGAIPVNPALIDAASNSAGDAADMLLMWGFGPDAQYGISAVPGMQPIAIGRQIMASNPLHADLVACGDYLNGSEVAKTIDVPAQLILARKDRLTPVKAGMAFAEELNASVTVIERYGHMLPIEAPRQTLQKLRELIGSLENTA